MDIKKYIYSHCVQPVRVRVFDTYTQNFVVRELPCGKCLHCVNNHVNGWTTRLYAQAKYSKNVYYITLDYAPFDLRNPIALKLASETAAVYHNINFYKKFAMQPILLKKNHLQDFFKRFRKNTGKKIQYFACGEYGTHANGHGFGRPHFHIIVFSNDAISQKEFQDAWTLDGYKIGNVDFHDLVANGSFQEIKDKSIQNPYNAKYVFKYVCKYLQKDSFNFENLATIDFHRIYFKTLQEYQINTDTLFPESRPIKDKQQLESNWAEYIKNYSPFVCCSKRPSIGLQYFKDNCDRFTKQDFSLFGLPKECDTFPLYYVRKTKELLCPFSAIGKESAQVSSNSRVGTILYTLRQMYVARTNIANLGSYPENLWHKRKMFNSVNGFNNNLHMYDNFERTFYQFNGYSYTLWKKVRGIGMVRMCDMDIYDVYNKVVPMWQEYYNVCIKPCHLKQVIREQELSDTIYSTYGGLNDSFFSDVWYIYNAELSLLYKNKLLTQNSKLTL